MKELKKIISGVKYLNLAAINLLLSQKTGSLKKYIGSIRLEYFNQRRIGLPVRKFVEIFPKCQHKPTSVQILTEEKSGGLTTLELCYLSSIVKCYPIRSIFEIGTFDGCAVTHMLLNSQVPDQCRIFTLDLPDKVDPNYSYDPENKEFLELRRPGYYINRYTTGGISQLYGDSLTFDFSPYHDSMDLVFVDGNHNPPYIQKDTENALKMLKSGGLLIWHDYFGVPGEAVADYLNRLSANLPLARIKDTCLAVYKKNEK